MSSIEQDIIGQEAALHLGLANERQVGGTHYRNSFQHWDFAALLGMGYFEGQITKYGTRHRSKKGLEDLEKCDHFIAKLYELAAQGKKPQCQKCNAETIVDYAAANLLTALEMRLVKLVTQWRSLKDLQNLRVLVTALKEAHYGKHREEGADPGPAYVNQG